MGMFGVKINGSQHWGLCTPRDSGDHMAVTTLAVTTLSASTKRWLGDTLFINRLTLGEVWQYLLLGTHTLAPRSTFLCLIAPVASNLPIGNELISLQRQLF